MLDGRRVTTHWMYAERLAAEYPSIHVQPDVLYVDDGQVLTSAGTSAGIDLSLYIVRHDHGAEIANYIARRMVVPPHRDGGQAQFLIQPMPDSSEADTLGPTLDWIVDNLDRPLTIEEMAAHALMSTRTFMRRFRAATGTTPLRWLSQQRVEHRAPRAREHRCTGRPRRPGQRLRERGQLPGALPAHGRNRADVVPTRVPGLSPFTRTGQDPAAARAG